MELDTKQLWLIQYALETAMDNTGDDELYEQLEALFEQIESVLLKKDK